MQVKVSPLGQTGDLWVRSYGLISLNFTYRVKFKDFFYAKLCVFSHSKGIKHVYRNFYFVTWFMHQWSDLGVLGGSKS